MTIGRKIWLRMAFIFAAVGIGLGTLIGLSVVGQTGLAVMSLIFVWQCVRFIRTLEPARARLRQTAEGWALGSLLVWCVDLLMSHPGAWVLV